MTAYDDIYGRFLGKIQDYDILNATDEIANSMLHDFLLSSISKFTYCKKDLSNRDKITATFNIELNELEQEILATLMCVEYMSPKILRSELLEQQLGSKDFRLYSPANQLKETRELRESLKLEANQLMMDYYYTVDENE